jgi:soluble lytic murein transglycosylase-like protein
MIPLPKFSSEQIYNLIDKYGGEYHVNPNFIRKIAICESGFNPLAKRSVYGGLFQFTSQTWSSYRRLMKLDPHPDLRFNAEEAIRTTAYILSINQAQNWPKCGLP